MEQITISLREYKTLKQKAEAYDKIIANNSIAGKTSSNNLTPEQRHERAKKAVAARMAKYNQKSRKS